MVATLTTGSSRRTRAHRPLGGDVGGEREATLIGSDRFGSISTTWSPVWPARYDEQGRKADDLSVWRRPHRRDREWKVFGERSAGRAGRRADRRRSDCSRGGAARRSGVPTPDRPL